MNRILVIGDIMLDNYLVGNCERISPEAPVQIVDVESEKLVLGGAGNVVRNIISLSGKADILSVIGDCENTRLLFNLLENENINTNFLVTETGRLTSKKVRIMAAKHQVVRYDKETKTDVTPATQTRLLAIYDNIIDNYQIVILSDYGKGVLTANITQKFITRANAKNIKVLVDPKGSDYTKYFGAYLLTPNKAEAELATGLIITKSNIEKALVKLRDIAKLQKSIITLSEEGIAIFDETLRIHPTKAREVFDVTGAGDTVIAALALQLAQHNNIDEAVQFANLAASVVVSKIGSATATLDEIHSYHSRVQTKTQITKIAKNLRLEDKCVVFTNGCFDILHFGHIKYLEEAKKLGDVLIVGVNADASVKRLKGDDRPINTEFDRAYLLGALKVVDYVVIFDEDTPYELIAAIRPHILVKGGDYKDKKIVGSDIATITRLIDFVDDKSTTKIINKIKK